MNINEMSDQEKSVMLARLCGWKHEHLPPKIGDTLGLNIVTDKNGDLLHKGWFSFPLAYPTIPSLYDPENMPLAWRVLNWALDHLTAPSHFFQLRQMVGDMDLFVLPRDAAQRAWLDKILELATEAGMVKTQQEKPE